MANFQYNPNHVSRADNSDCSGEITRGSIPWNQQTYLESSSSYDQTDGFDTPTSSSQQTTFLKGRAPVMSLIGMPEVSEYGNNFRPQLPGASSASVYEDFRLGSRMPGSEINIPSRDQQVPEYDKNPTPGDWNLNDYGQEVPNIDEHRTYDQGHMISTSFDPNFIGRGRTSSCEVQMRLYPFQGMFHERPISDIQLGEIIPEQGGQGYNAPQRSPAPNKAVQLPGTNTSFDSGHVAHERQGPSLYPIAPRGISSDPSIHCPNAGRMAALPVNRSGWTSQDVWSGSDPSQVGYSQITTRSRPSPKVSDVDEYWLSSQAPSPSDLGHWSDAFEANDSFGRRASSSSAKSLTTFAAFRPRRASRQSAPTIPLPDDYKNQTTLETPSQSASSSVLNPQEYEPYNEKQETRNTTHHALPLARPQWKNFNENVPGASSQQGFYPDEHSYSNDLAASPFDQAGSQYSPSLDAPFPRRRISSTDTYATRGDQHSIFPRNPDVRTISFGEGNLAVRYHPVTSIFWFVQKLNLYTESVKFLDFRRLSAMQ